MDVPGGLVVLEVGTTNDRRVPPWVPGQKVLLTNLVTASSRCCYELTDSVTLAGGTNPSGCPMPASSRRRPQRRHHHPGGGRRRRGRGPPVPPVGAVLELLGSASTRWSTTRPACTRGRAARARPGRHPGPGPGRLVRELHDSGAVRRRSQVTPFPGSSATQAMGQVQLVRSTVPPAAGARGQPDGRGPRVTTLTIRPGTWTTRPPAHPRPGAPPARWPAPPAHLLIGRALADGDLAAAPLRRP